MTAPRIEIDFDKIRHNARTLVERLGQRRISVTGVTKAALGSPELGKLLIGAGVSDLGDSRIENIETMRSAGIRGSVTLLRSPMLSQAQRVVEHATASLNTEIDVIRRLSQCAQQVDREHEVILMVELGDLREGIMPGDLEGMVHRTLQLPNIVLRGIGTNLACRHGVTPDAANMDQLSSLATKTEAAFGIRFASVSGGNSANLTWALSGAETGRINDLRLGESILLGCDPLSRKPISGLYTDAFTLVAEVIELKTKPQAPTGELQQSAFGEPTAASGSGATESGAISQCILGIGRQDVDPAGLRAPSGIKLLAATSDHLVVRLAGQFLSVGSEVRFDVGYSALLRAMTSPFVVKVVKSEGTHRSLGRPGLAAPKSYAM